MVRPMVTSLVAYWHHNELYWYPAVNSLSVVATGALKSFIQSTYLDNLVITLLNTISCGQKAQHLRSQREAICD